MASRYLEELNDLAGGELGVFWRAWVWHSLRQIDDCLLFVVKGRRSKQCIRLRSIEAKAVANKIKAAV